MGAFILVSNKLIKMEKNKIVDASKRSANVNAYNFEGKKRTKKNADDNVKGDQNDKGKISYQITLVTFDVR